MNVLDNHITDLDNRIKEICEIAPTVEKSSIQESLSSYGWILLDSWIAWRTLRFLLRDQDIKPDIQKKWFQTPSSFTASQIKAVWHFGESVDCYLTKETGYGIKHVIDNDIEKKRNSSAHFSNSGEIRGSDYQRIKKYHELFSNIFLLYEIVAFFYTLSSSIAGFDNSYLFFINNDGKNVLVKHYNEGIVDYNFSIIDMNEIALIKMKFALNKKEAYLTFDRDGCYFFDVKEEKNKTYILFTNKGYYRDIVFIKEKINVLYK